MIDQHLYSNGNLAKITDAEGNATDYVYDLFDRLDVMSYADGSSVNYDYDANSNLDFVTLPGTHGTMDLVYDQLNRLIEQKFPNNPARDMAFAYDLGSRMVAADNNASEIDYIYDALNRVTQATQRVNGTNYVIGYAYEANGNRKQIVYPSLKTTDQIFDDNDRLDVL